MLKAQAESLFSRLHEILFDNSDAAYNDRDYLPQPCPVGYDRLAWAGLSYKDQVDFINAAKEASEGATSSFVVVGGCGDDVCGIGIDIGFVSGPGAVGGASTAHHATHHPSESL